MKKVKETINEISINKENTKSTTSVHVLINSLNEIFIFIACSSLWIYVLCLTSIYGWHTPLDPYPTYVIELEYWIPKAGAIIPDLWNEIWTSGWFLESLKYLKKFTFVPFV